MLKMFDKRTDFQGIYESQQSCTSGSGSGAPLLAQRTVASNIHLYDIIGQYTTMLIFIGTNF